MVLYWRCFFMCLQETFGVQFPNMSIFTLLRVCTFYWVPTVFRSFTKFSILFVVKYCGLRPHSHNVAFSLQNIFLKVEYRIFVGFLSEICRRKVFVLRRNFTWYIYEAFFRCWRIWDFNLKDLLSFNLCSAFGCSC